MSLRILVPVVKHGYGRHVVQEFTGGQNPQISSRVDSSVPVTVYYQNNRHVSSEGKLEELEKKKQNIAPRVRCGRWLTRTFF